MPNKRNFTRTINAINDFDVADKNFDKIIMQETVTQEILEKEYDKLDKLNKKIGVAYQLDTADVNCKDVSNVVKLGKWLIEIIKENHDPNVPQINLKENQCIFNFYCRINQDCVYSTAEKNKDCIYCVAVYNGYMCLSTIAQANAMILKLKLIGIE